MSQIEKNHNIMLDPFLYCAADHLKSLTTWVYIAWLSSIGAQLVYVLIFSALPTMLLWDNGWYIWRLLDGFLLELPVLKLPLYVHKQGECNLLVSRITCTYVTIQFKAMYNSPWYISLEIKEYLLLWDSSGKYVTLNYSTTKNFY